MKTYIVETGFLVAVESQNDSKEKQYAFITPPITSPLEKVEVVLKSDYDELLNKYREIQIYNYKGEV